MTSEHYLVSLKQKETREEATIKDRKCKRQKQLANKEKNVFKKVNWKKDKHWWLLDKEKKRRFNEALSMKNIAIQSDALHAPNYQE